MTQTLVLVGDKCTPMTRKLLHKDDHIQVYRTTITIPLPFDNEGLSYYHKIEIYYPGSLLKMRAKP